MKLELTMKAKDQKRQTNSEWRTVESTALILYVGNDISEYQYVDWKYPSIVERASTWEQCGRACLVWISI